MLEWFRHANQTNCFIKTFISLICPEKSFSAPGDDTSSLLLKELLPLFGWSIVATV
jgi:hypothetical protein